MVEPVFDLKQVIFWLVVLVVLLVIWGCLWNSIINDIRRRL